MVSPTTTGRTTEGGTFSDRLRAAAAGIGRPISGEETERLELHYRLLIHWGRRVNLTGIKGEAEIIRRHFLEPIAAADLLGVSGRLIDIGSGNGFPAVPLAVLGPGLDLVLVESSEKRSAFLWAVIRELRLKGARVETRRVRRISDLADLLPTRYLTFRAVRGGDLLRGGGGPILEPGGRALAFVSASESESLRQDPPPGLRWVADRPLPSGTGSVVVTLEPA